MDLALAQKVLAGAIAHAEQIGVALSFSIADDTGHEILTAHMDGAPWFTPHIARTPHVSQLVRRTSHYSRLAD